MRRLIFIGLMSLAAPALADWQCSGSVSVGCGGSSCTMQALWCPDPNNCGQAATCALMHDGGGGMCGQGPYFYCANIVCGGPPTCPPVCIPNCSCASSTCVGNTCHDGCGGNCSGTLNCAPPPPPPSCVPNCSCAASTCLGNVCANGCGGNCAGTLNCSPPPPPPPPPPPCGFGICGQVSALEAPLVNLKDVVVELRNAEGIHLQSVKNDPVAGYLFPAPPPGSAYLSVAVDRHQIAVPPLIRHVKIGNKYDFTVRGVPASVIVNEKPGTFIIVTTAPLVSGPPTIDQTSGHVPTAFSSTIDLNGIRTLKIPAGHYYLTCWRPEPSVCGGKTIYRRYPIVGSLTLDAPTPQTTVTLPAPACGASVMNCS
jgi:hypothetical protein